LSQSTIAAAAKSDADVDDIVPDSDDFVVPLSEVDVWIDPLDATQVS
jgi:hypothetical protein